MEKSVIFILLITIGGSMVAGLFEDCDEDKCDHEILMEEYNNLRGLPPNEEELKKMCPPAVKFMECAWDLTLKCTGKTVEEIIVSGNVTEATIMDLVLSIRSVILDVCDEDSLLHKNYLSSISCVRSTLFQAAEECMMEGRELYTVYKTSVAELIDDDDDHNRECMVIGYTFACLSTQFRDKCSETAGHTLLEILRRTKLVKLNFCSPKQLQTMKTKFLNFLEEQGESRDIIAAAFDFRRRK